MNKWTSRAQAAGMSLVLAVLLIVGVGMEARGQERVFDISALQAQAPAGNAGARSSGMQQRAVSAIASQTARTADAQAGPVLTPERIADFQSLYFNVQPAVYYNAGGSANDTDAADGGGPTTIYVEPSELTRLEADAAKENSRLAAARLLVLQDAPTGSISQLLGDDSVLPNLEFVVIKSQSGSGQLQSQAVHNLFGADIFTKRPDLIVVYNNLELAQ